MKVDVGMGTVSSPICFYWKKALEKWVGIMLWRDFSIVLKILCW
jgi:hypothetical protein